MTSIIENDYCIKSHLIKKGVSNPVSILLLAVFSNFLFTLIVKGQTAQFTALPADGNFCAPAKINFVPSFSEKPEYLFWNFGTNGEESELNSPAFTYTSPGTYQVVLTVVFKNVIREVTANVNIYGVLPFTIQSQKDFLCKPGPNIFTLKNVDTLSKAIWDFGNGNKLVSNNNAPVQYSFPDFGSYNISVEVENARGCKSVNSAIFPVEKPKAFIKDTLINGCLPAKVNFTAQITLPSGSTVSKYIWNFDDGSAPQTTVENSVFHTFSAADTFVTTLSITSSEGCEGNFSFPPVAFGMPTVLSGINASKDTLCASEVLFLTANAAKANSFLWEISDGSAVETKEGSFSYKFKGLGTHRIKVTPKFNGCPGLADSIRVFVRGVIANYSFSNSCAQKNRFNFRNTSNGNVNSFQWNFEGNLSSVTVANPEYVFPEQGKFPFGMIVKNNATGCADTTGGFIYTAKPRLEPSDTFTCLGTLATLVVRDSYSNPRTTYNWNFAGKIVSSGSSGSLSLTADIEGLFSNQVIISNGAGYCRDTLTQPLKLRVAGISADFETNSAKCTKAGIVFQNTSSSKFGFTAGTRWNWDFGNGLISEDQSPAPVVYPNPGSVKVSLMVTDSKGCADSVKKVIRIMRSPLLKLLPKTQKVCQGQEFSLSAYHTSNILWSPSNLVDCDTCSTVKVKPLKPTEYLVIAKDSLGCTTIDTVKLDVWYPFDLSPDLMRDTAVCYGTSVQYDLKIDQKIITWSPNFGLSSVNLPNPLANPEFTTTYIITVSDSARCFTRKDSAVLTINPLPTIEHDSLLIVPFDQPFTIKPKYSNNILTYKWQPSNLLSCTDCPNPSGKATGSAFFELEVVSDKGCTSSAKINLVIDCSNNNIHMPTAFSPDRNGLNDYYYPLTRGIRQIKRFAVFNRFGEIVFEKREFIPNNRLDGWDGTFKGVLQPPGFYTYWVEILCGSGNLQSYKGNFFLFR